LYNNFIFDLRASFIDKFDGVPAFFSCTHILLAFEKNLFSFERELKNEKFPENYNGNLRLVLEKTNKTFMASNITWMSTVGLFTIMIPKV